MELGLEFKIDNQNNIVVKDTTKYEDVPNNTFNSFTKFNSGSIYVLGYHYKHNEIEYTKPLYINQHTEYSQYRINVPKDGWITLYHIILPTKEYVDSLPIDVVRETDYVYYIYEGKVYDRNHNDNIVDIDTMLSVNPNLTSILIDEQDYISIWNLQKCLVDLCLEIFNNLDAFGHCFNSNNISDELKYRRDLVWMAIHVIKYLARYNMKPEAARIINQLEGCNGVCTKTRTKGVRGCGCNKGSKT